LRWIDANGCENESKKTIAPYCQLAAPDLASAVSDPASMTDLIPIVGILVVCTLLYLSYLVSIRQANKNWQAVQATYEIVGSKVPRGDIIHGVYYLRISYTFDSRAFSKLITLHYNRHTLEHHTFDPEGLHNSRNSLWILVNPKNPKLILYERAPWWNHLLAVAVIIFLWSVIGYSLLRQR